MSKENPKPSRVAASPRSRETHESASHAIVDEVEDRLPAAPGWGRRRWLIIVGAGLASLIVGTVVFRKSAEPPASAGQPPPVAMDGTKVRFSEEFATRNKVTSESVSMAPLSPTLRVTGTIRYDIRKYSAIGARSAGRVRKVLHIMGDEVKAGTVLADIESVDVGRAQASAEALRARELAALSNLEREEQLALAKVAAARDAELAKAEHRALLAERKAAEKTVAALGATAGNEVGIIKLKSPIAGRIILAKVSQGQIVDPTDTLFEVADLSKVWAELSVFERDLHRIAEGDSVEILPAGGEVRIHAKVAKIGSVIDLTTRTAVVRVEVDNKEGLLRPGQSITARLHLRETGERALVVPKSAVTFVDGKPTVLALVSPGLVEPRGVELGSDDGERVAVRAGLREGDKIIVQGVFALKSEIFR